MLPSCAEHIGTATQQRGGVPRPDRRAARRSASSTRRRRSRRGWTPSWWSSSSPAAGRSSTRTCGCWRCGREACCRPGRCTYTWVPRERNKHADRLANEALDAAARGEAWSPADSTRRAGTGHGRALGRRVPTSSRPADTLVGWDVGLGTPTTTVLLRHGETAHTVEQAVQRVAAAHDPRAVGRRASAQARPRRRPLAAPPAGSTPSSARRCGAPGRPPTPWRPRWA